MERMGPIEHNFSEGKGAGMPEQKPEPQESPAEQNPEEILGPQLPNEEEPFKPVTEDEFIRKENPRVSRLHSESTQFFTHPVGQSGHFGNRAIYDVRSSS